MSGPFAGGHRITGVSVEGAFALRVRFETTYPTMCHQVYVGRTLAGQTESAGDTEIICSYVPSDWPEHGPQLLAVEVANRFTDYGAALPPRPYNSVKLKWTTTGWSPNTRFCEVTGGTEPGGAVDLENVLERVLFDTDREYEFVTDPLPGTGEWEFEIAGRDATLPDGNRGTAASVTADIYAHPPDVDFASDGYNRFELVAAGGELTVSFTESSL